MEIKVRLPGAHWAEDVMYSNFVRNRLRTMVNKDQKIPFEINIGRNEIYLIHVYSAAKFSGMHVLKQLRSGKFSAWAKEGIVVEIDGGDAFRISLADTTKIKISKDITLDELCGC